MYKRLILIFIIALPSWYYTDMDSPSRFFAYVLPIILFVCLIAFCLWVIDLFEHFGSQDKSRHS